MSAAFQEGRTALRGHHCQTAVRARPIFMTSQRLDCIKFCIDVSTFIISVLLATLQVDFFQSSHKGGGGVVASRGSCCGQNH